MTRHTATVTAPATLWGEIETAASRIGKFFAAPASAESGLEALEREHARIRLSSRHWLMG